VDSAVKDMDAHSSLLFYLASTTSGCSGLEKKSIDLTSGSF